MKETVVTAVKRLKINIRGVVQGVGFRPFVYNLALKSDCRGWIRNTSQGVEIEVEGNPADLARFVEDIEKKKPPAAQIDILDIFESEPRGDETGFAILDSGLKGDKTALILPDLAVCPECQKEIFDPANRRYLYPFTNCTNCGPRFSIIESLPYDRVNTTMRRFKMCPACEEEYNNPSDRRFHAQPNACPECGPRLELWDRGGNVLASRQPALMLTVEALKNGEIAAVKGLGGFHLMTDARDGEAIEKLRRRKHREEKPFALMFPDLNSIAECCEIGSEEEAILNSPESPIMLLKRRIIGNDIISSAVAPGNPYLGAMLPYTPLHHILMREMGFPVVATSGNLAEEPICIDENEALTRLKGIAGVFLVHNRPIARHVDDSIVRIMAGQRALLRRARGFAPLPVKVKGVVDGCLAVGGHLKNTTAFSIGDNVFISQHIGDTGSEESQKAFSDAVAQFLNLYEKPPNMVAHDSHPDYFSTQYARKNYAALVVPIQHHEAHVYSCMADNGINPPFAAIAWDGTGYGADGTIWGGEFFRCDKNRNLSRTASLRQFRLPGGEAAITEPRRAALGMLFEMFADSAFQKAELEPLKAFNTIELRNLERMLKNKINSPLTSSAGRLFDAIASLLGIRHINSFEGQAAMELEFAVKENIDDYYEFEYHKDSDLERLDWSKIAEGVIDDHRRGISIGVIAAKFHNSLAEAIVEFAKRSGEKQVLLSGGCFQNKYLTERALNRLKMEGFTPVWHRNVPPNDGGISLGQVVGASSCDL